jgi:hypothetical protein
MRRRSYCSSTVLYASPLISEHKLKLSAHVLEPARLKIAMRAVPDAEPVTRSAPSQVSSYLVQRSSSRPRRRASFFSSAFCVASGMGASGSALREDNLFLSVILESSVSHDGEEGFWIERRVSAFLNHRQAPLKRSGRLQKILKLLGCSRFLASGLP